jgi:hypothetical protein
MITKTFEPIRPLRCADGDVADYHSALGTGRTFYGASYWPSASYSLWDCEEAREALRVHAGLRVEA